MRIYNRYIITVTILLLLTTVILIALGIGSLDAYYSSYVIEVLTVTEFYRYFSPQARRALEKTSLVFLGAFLLIIAVKAVSFLQR